MLNKEKKGLIPPLPNSLLKILYVQYSSTKERANFNLLTAAAIRLNFCFILSFHLYITLLYFLRYHALILLSVFAGISGEGISESSWALLLDLHDGE